MAFDDDGNFLWKEYIAVQASFSESKYRYLNKYILNKKYLIVFCQNIGFKLYYVGPSLLLYFLPIK